MPVLLQDLLERLRQVLRPNAAWYGLGAAIALTIIGVMAIGTAAPHFGARQVQLWLPAALLMALVCMLPHPRTIGYITYPAAAAILLLLLFIILPFAPRFFVPVRNGGPHGLTWGR